MVLTLPTILKGNTMAFTALPTVDGVVSEITGTIGFIVKKNRTDPDSEAVILKESTDGNFQLVPSDTEGLSGGRYWYEFRWFFGNAVHTLRMGELIVVQTVYD